MPQETATGAPPGVRVRGQLLSFIDDTKWVLLLTGLISVMLFQPDQMREIYRIVHSDELFVERLRLGVAATGIALLCYWAALQVAMSSLERARHVYDPEVDPAGSLLPPQTALRDVARRGVGPIGWLYIALPVLAGVTPMLAFAGGLYLSSPNVGQRIAPFSSVVGSPWEQYAVQSTKVTAAALGISALLAVIVAIVLGAATLWLTQHAVHGSSRLRGVIDRFCRTSRRVSLPIAALLTAALVAALLRSPVELAQRIGVLGSLALFSASSLAVTVCLSHATIKYRFPWLPLVLGTAFLFSALDTNDNHEIRFVETAPATPAAEPPLAPAEFLKWYESRPDLAAFDEYPVYIVAAQGGGIYAAYHNATFLARMQDFCPLFRDHLLAISSVSGGSVGAAAFTAVLNQKRTVPGADTAAGSPDNPCPRIAAVLEGDRYTRSNSFDQKGPRERDVDRLLSSDYLSPLVAGTLFPDFAQRFIPLAIPALDRARALEKGFEFSMVKAGIDSDVGFEDSYLAHWNPARSSPALLMNTTDAGSGRRVVMAPFLIQSAAVDRESSLIQFPFWRGEQVAPAELRIPARVANTDMRMSTAAGLSARFPWLTPAATLPVVDNATGRESKLRLVDGGYIDNSGVDTVLDLIDALKPVADEIRRRAADPSLKLPGRNVTYRPVSFKLIVLSSAEYPKRTSYSYGETLEPIRALLSTRESRASTAIERAERQFPPQDIAKVVIGTTTSVVSVSDVRRMALKAALYEMPLGWRLSERTRDIISKQSGRFWECEPDHRMAQSKNGLSDADCVQLTVYYDLTRTLKQAANDQAILLGVHAPVAASAPVPARLDHQRLMSCYRDARKISLNLQQARALQALLQEWDRRTDLTEPKWLAFILATVAVETADFAVREENLRYSTARRIMLVWPSLFKSAEEAQPYVGNPRLLANKVYGGRFGNTAPEDGWQYRGRGLVWLTGKANYQRFSSAPGVDLETYPELIFNSTVGAKVAYATVFPPVRMARLSAALSATSSDWVAARRGYAPSFVDGFVDRAHQFMDCIQAASGLSPAYSAPP